MKNAKDLTRKLLSGQISRREFVERAAGGALGFAATVSALSTAEAQERSQASSSAKKPDFNQTNVDPYAEWLTREGIPLYKGYAVEDCHTLKLGPWKRVGGNGAHIDLIGGEGCNCAYVSELPVGGSTNPQRYMFEEVLYVLDGEGETEVWQPNGRKHTVRWQAGSVIGPPLNTWRQHFNRGRTPSRMLSVNNAVVVIDLFHNTEFVFNNDYVFRDRFNNEEGFFGAGDDKLHLKMSEETEQRGGVYTWDSGYVPNARTLGLKQVLSRGAGNSRIELQLADNAMQAHISEFEVGTYKKAHRHGPGSHVVMLNGKGYTLLWKGAVRYSDATEVKMRVDWKEGSLFVPPDGWFHQHFNTSNDPARYLAPTWGGDGKWFTRSVGGGGRTHRLGKTSTRKGGNLVEYEDEDPQIKEIYQSELKKSGVQYRMSSIKG